MTDQELVTEATDRAYAMQEDAPEVSALIARLANALDGSMARLEECHKLRNGLIEAAASRGGTTVPATQRPWSEPSPTWTQNQVMDAMEQAVEACARQWFKEKLPTEAWVVDYAGILARRAEERTTPTLRAPEVTDEIWAAYRSGYLNGVSEPKAQIEGYEAWCAHAEAGATAYIAILNTPPNANVARQQWLADRRKGSATPKSTPTGREDAQKA